MNTIRMKQRVCILLLSLNAAADATGLSAFINQKASQSEISASIIHRDGILLANCGHVKGYDSSCNLSLSVGGSSWVTFQNKGTTPAWFKGRMGEPNHVFPQTSTCTPNLKLEVGDTCIAPFLGLSQGIDVFTYTFQGDNGLSTTVRVTVTVS